MIKTLLTLRCCICAKEIELWVDTPDGWVANDLYDDMYVFCPEHRVIGEFEEAQCSGCVGGWQECTLWFMLVRKELTNDDIASIEKGICPRRTNGTGFFDTNTGKLGRIDLSTPAPESVSKAFAEAIKKHFDYKEEEENVS